MTCITAQHVKLFANTLLGSTAPSSRSSRQDRAAGATRIAAVHPTCTFASQGESHKPQVTDQPAPFGVMFWIAVLAGKLHAVIGPPRTVQGSRSHGPYFTIWLTKHARLLQSLRVLGSKPEEDDITAGLTAAAAAAATFPTANWQPPSNAPGLPLQSLACYATCAGSIFSGLARATQLTSLTLCIDLSSLGWRSRASQPVRTHHLVRCSQPCARLPLVQTACMGPTHCISTTSASCTLHGSTSQR